MTEPTRLIVPEQRQRVVETSADPMTAMIERAARDPSVDIEKLERLFQLRQRMADEAREDAFNTAMNAAQSEMSRVAADATNPQTHSKYASYAQLDNALRPIYTKHGFSISFDEGDSPKADHVRVLGYVSHIGGHTRTYRTDMPADGKGAKGGDVMTKTHAAGAAKSYGKRYILKDVFNVAVGEGDRDGNTVRPLISEKQAMDLEALISEVGANKEAYLRYLKVDSLEDILAASYSAAVQALEAKRKK